MEMMGVGVGERAADRILGFGAEETIERAIRRDNMHPRVKNNQRLANRIDDFFGIGSRCLDLPFGRFVLRDVGKSDHYPFDPIVMGAIG